MAQRKRRAGRSSESGPLRSNPIDITLAVVLGVVASLIVVGAILVRSVGFPMAQLEMGRSMTSARTDADAQEVEQGKALYEVHCQACHGPEAVGERPDEPGAVDEQGLPYAPALNGAAHSWHHTDEGLALTILEGSPRNPRMIAWGKAGLDEVDARAIISYMKSLWGEVQLRCQGPGHMDPNCLRGG